MVSEDENGEPETVFCINCGEEIAADTDFCPECGSGQDPEDLAGDDEPVDHNGFTSWAIGFEPGNTMRNVLVGIAYFVFYYVGIPLLVYAYLDENPGAKKYFAWVGGGLLILVGLAMFSQANARGIAAGILALGLGLFFLPTVRQRSGIGDVPGITDGNSTRRNLLTGVGYGLGSVIAVGVLAPETEDSEASNDGTDSSGSGGDGSGDETSTDEPASSGDEETATAEPTPTPTAEQEEFPNAWAYDENSGLAFYDVEGTGDEYSINITGEVVNESGGDYDYVQLSFGLYNASDTKVGDALANTNGLADGQRWRFEAVGTSSETVDTFSLDDITAY